MSDSRPEEPVSLIRKRLDETAMMEHFEQLAATARLVELRLKDEGTSRSVASAQPSSRELVDAAHRLQNGEVAAVQVRFVEDDIGWCDTVLRKGDSYRLVRMRS